MFCAWHLFKRVKPTSLVVASILAAATLFSPLSSARAQASTLVNNLPGQNSYGGWNDWPFGSAQLTNSTNFAAQRFTSGGSNYTDQLLTVTLWSQTLAGAVAMPLSIYKGSPTSPGFVPGNPSNNLVAQFVFQGAFNIADGTLVASPTTSNAYLNRYASPSALALLAGINYWVVVSGLDGSDFVWDSGTNQAPVTNAPPGTSFGSGFAWGSNAQWDGSSWQPYNAGQALMMEVQSVPEPSTYALLGLGALALGARVVRSRRK